MSATPLDDAHYMRQALQLAQRAWGQTHPNPLVGAVLVENGTVVAKGWHAAAGQAHAEVAALQALGRQPLAGASLYVTLEPCSTCGRTGACTEAIIQAGLARVVVGALDPNPAHAGRGLAILRAAGIEVVAGVLAEACTDLNLIFNHWITRCTPFIAAKMALTLDGKFAAASGESRWVTGNAARADVMRWRRYFPAIAVGAATVVADNPSLTARLDSGVWCPQRFVFDRSLRTLEREPLPKIFTDSYADKTIIVCLAGVAEAAKARAEELGLQLWCLPERDGYFDWAAFRQRCADTAIYGVFVETGPRLATVLLEARRVDYVFVYQAPKFMSDQMAPGIGSLRDTQLMAAAIHLQQPRFETFAEDRLTRGFIES